jgi:hypothetical protein
MACRPVDTHAHASEDQHVGADMASMLHADRGHARVEAWDHPGYSQGSFRRDASEYF